MEKRNISKDLLYSQNHFDILLKLYHTSFNDNNTLENIYEIITESVVDGLKIDRAGFWKISVNKLICINLFDRDLKFHSVEKEINSRDIPIYFKALSEGIAIVANDALTNKYTKELKENYLIPLGITDMLDLPILENGKLIGVLCCEHRDSNRKWSETDLAFARSIGDIFTTMLEYYHSRIIIKKLIESERKLSLITDNSNDGFVVFENKKITYISNSYRNLLGFTEEEALHMTIEDVFNHVHQDDIENMKSIIYGNLSKNTRNFSYVFRFKGKDQNYYWREDTASVLYDVEGNYTKYIIISRDINVLKNAEIEIQKLYLISKTQNEKLLDFTHIISHNIRSNSSNMSMLIDLIDGTNDVQEKEEFFQLLKLSNNKLSDTIYSLNETINIQLNTKEQKVNLNLKSEVNKILLGINGIIKQENIKIKILFDDNLDVLTIPTYFESILLNLITNAIKYKSLNRDTIIEIEAFYGNKQFVLKVKDNGLGIDLIKNKNKLFGMYRTFHGNENAIGLGLFMTKNHIEAMGGTIEVESEVGKGSTFIITLND